MYIEKDQEISVHLDQESKNIYQKFKENIAINKGFF